MNKLGLIQLLENQRKNRLDYEVSMYKLGLMRKYFEAKARREDMDFILHMVNKLDD